MASRAVRTTSAALPVTVVGIVAGGKDAVGRLRTLPLPPPPPPPPPLLPTAKGTPAARDPRPGSGPRHRARTARSGATPAPPPYSTGPRAAAAPYRSRDRARRRAADT